jgi:hypothetical protein
MGGSWCLHAMSDLGKSGPTAMSPPMSGLPESGRRADIGRLWNVDSGLFRSYVCGLYDRRPVGNFALHQNGERLLTSPGLARDVAAEIAANQRDEVAPFHCAATAMRSLQ